MSALQYVDVPGYAAILFRRTFAELSKPDALMDRAHAWLRGTDAHWEAYRHTYVFPSGAQLVFSHLENEMSKYEHQSAAYQFCVARGTPILLANGHYQPVEMLKPGMLVATLQGPRPLTYCAPPRAEFCYALHTAGTVTVVSASHQILTTQGWHAPLGEIARQCHAGDTTSAMSQALSEAPHLHIHSPPWDQQQGDVPGFPPRQARGLLGNDAWLANAQIGCGASADGHQGGPLLHGWSVPGVLYGPALHPKMHGNAAWNRRHGAPHAHCGKADRVNLHSGCHGGYDSHDARFLQDLRDVRDNIPLQGGVAARFHPLVHGDDPEHILRYIPRPYEYSHPYTRLPVQTDTPLVSADIGMVPVGVQVVYDLRVAEASHYISFGGIISQNCGFDETTSFTESMYRFLFSRLRRLRGVAVPIRMRAASNPGGIGHGWVRQRFMVEQDPQRAFVPARQLDNPHLDVEAYEQSLAQLDPITRQRLRAGDWDITEEGKLFKPHWFAVVPDYPRVARMIRFWDFAGTEVTLTRGGELRNDPDWTVGLKLAEYRGQYWVVDVRRARLSPKGVEDLVSQTAALDGAHVDIWLEQEPGSSGKAVIEDYQRRVLKGYAVYAQRSTGSKVERAKPASSAAEAGNIAVIAGPWNATFLEELSLFPQQGVHDDQVDTLSGGINVLRDAPKRAGAWGRG
jgi:predicted phage terminase large subunit-like protein